MLNFMIKKSMEVENTDLEGLKIIKPQVFKDERGFFFESYNIEKMKKAGIKTVFVQSNHSKSVKNTLRGLHFQIPPGGQVKLVRCSRGIIWDVAVDIRKGSSTFGKWFGIELSENNFKQFYIPIGFAHGFCVLSDVAEVQYECSAVYNKDLESGIMWNDPDLAVDWPVKKPLLSDRDTQNKLFAEFNKNNPFVF